MLRPREVGRVVGCGRVPMLESLSTFYDLEGIESVLVCRF